MNRIIIDYPEDCTEQIAVEYLTGCFKPCQHDYKKVEEGYHNGYGLTFCDGREAYFYKTMHGNYVLKIAEKDVK